MRSFIIAFALIWLLAGCQSTRAVMVGPSPGDDDWAPTVVDAKPMHRAEGSLYASSQLFTLFQDRRAYRVGDILTITLDEATESSKRSNTSIGKQSSLGAGAPVLGTRTIEELAAALEAERSFSGEASANQRNSLSGYITVTVSEVMANGVLAVHGEKWLRLNQGDEFIRLKGLVRVHDIDDRNRVSSQRIANAHITYSGRGAMAQANQPGWLTRFFQSPLFPF